MGMINDRTGRRVHADTLRIWPWLLLLILSGVTWFLPLSPAVKTLESRPRPPFLSENEQPVQEHEVDKNKNETDQIIKKTLKDAGCEGGKNFLGQDCSLIEKVLTHMNKELFNVEKEEEEAEEDFPWNDEPDILPELKVNCWCPAQFEDVHVDYTNRFCASQVNRNIRSLEFNDRSYQNFPQLKTDRQNDLNALIRKMTKRKVYIERKDLFKRYNNFVTRKTSFLMFIFVLVLLLPSLLWWKLSSSIWCGFNIDKTLDLMEQAQRSRPDIGRNMYQTISKNTANISCNKLAKFFLVCKLLVCCASLAVLFSFCLVLQPQADALVKELDELSDIAKLHPLNDHFLFFCDFVIRQLQNVHDYSVQCITSFTERDGSMDRESTKYSDLDDARRTLIVYGTLFQIISAFIILHVTVNACGFLTWIWKIYLDNIFFNSSGKSRNARASEDVRFFLYVVHEQLGHVVSKELSESLIPDTPDTAMPFLDPEKKGEMSDDNV